jgi:cytochrome c peroxidase
VGVRLAIAGALFAILPTAYSDPSAPPPPNSVSAAQIPRPANAPAYFTPQYLQMLSSPLPALIYNQGGIPPLIGQFELFADPAGLHGNFQPAGPTVTATNAFFQSLGTNGRSCATCHQPPNGMSFTPAHAQAVFASVGVKDPLFAPVDGANCPNKVPRASTSGALFGGRTGSASLTDLRTAYSLILNKGLIRIPLPVPTQTSGANPHDVEFTIQLVSDPNGCNTDPAYNQITDPGTGETSRIISVYRRPLMASNLKFKTTTLANSPLGIFPPIDPATGEPLEVDPFTGMFASRNIMWDGREVTLQSQAVDATLGHAQATQVPTADQVAQIMAFQTRFFSAQQVVSSVDVAVGANGGAKFLSAQSPSITVAATLPVISFTEFDSFSTTPSSSALAAQLRASIARGQAIFNARVFTVNNAAGFNGVGLPASFPSSCTGCHSQEHGGEDSFPAAQIGIGVGGDTPELAGPLPDPKLPILKITCKSGVNTGFHGLTVETNDPGLALITGKCADVGRFTTPPLRGLASRAPYFHDGTAATLLDVVKFYDKRFNIQFTNQEKQDLVNFLNAL